VLVVPSASSAARNRIHRRASAAATHATRHARLRVLGARRHVGWRDCAVAGVCDAGASRSCLSVASVRTLGQRRVRTTRAVVASTERVCTTRAKLVVGLPRHVGAELLTTVVLRAGSVCVPRGGARHAECRRRRCGARVVGLSRRAGAELLVIAALRVCSVCAQRGGARLAACKRRQPHVPLVLLQRVAMP
jgi:hypothetical protein